MIDVESRDPRQRYWVQCTRPELEGKLGSTFALANGVLGMRGAHEECPSWGRPEFYVAGTYAGGSADLLGFHDPDHILTHPDRISPEALAKLDEDVIWTLPNLPFPVAVALSINNVPFSNVTSRILSNERVLEMDNAVMRRCMVFRDSNGRRTRIDSCRFVSMADRNLVCLRYVVKPLDHDLPVKVNGYLFRDVANTNGVELWEPGKEINETERRALECVTRESKIRVAVAQAQTLTEYEGKIYLDLFAAAGVMSIDDALEKASAAAGKGYEACVTRHKRAFHRERAAAKVEFDGNPDTVQGFNFSQMHLHLAVGPETHKVGVPIKGLTGHGYRFLNFWDMDFHMFPYYLMTKPLIAKKLLEYRYSQLDQYRRNAKRWGARGAQVPWETNTRGDEETAPWLCLQDREIHNSAEAAYMFMAYAEITGDDSVMLSMGAEFVLETARFYASRLRLDKDKDRFELRDVGCPDQYHTFADNNVFISLWAKWNLEAAITIFEDDQYAAACSKVGLRYSDVDLWREMVDKLYIIEPNNQGIIEEFDGYFALDRDMEGISETYCKHSQAVKQPDVLAATVAFEELYSEEIRRQNYEFYSARTRHGSSLSRPGMAYAAARCGLLDEALYNLHKSCRLDLDDVNLDTERGIHVSGGAVQWLAVVFGFGGLTPKGDGLYFNPRLPRQWSHLNFSVYWHFNRLTVKLTHQTIAFEAAGSNRGPIRVRVGNHNPLRLQPGAVYDMEY